MPARGIEVLRLQPSLECGRVSCPVFFEHGIPGGVSVQTLDDLAAIEKIDEIIALDDALRRLQLQRPRVARIVELRFFAGLTVDETAQTLGVSPRTVDLDWAFARAWLYEELTDDAGTAEPCNDD